MASSVQLHDVSVATAAGQRIVRDVTLQIEPAESVALIGRSGAGKTTILRLLNGLAVPSSGSVAIDGKPLIASELAQRRRRIGTILQAPALFPHRTVFENIATVPRLLEWDAEKIHSAVTGILDRLGMPISTFGNRFPRSLSGGEQQRVGIARAMIAAPPLLLCDEPFSALDPIVRRELQDAFIALRSGGDVTVVFVTHDLAEAVRVARRIVLVDAGTIVCDEPRDAFLASNVPLVRKFIEATNVV
jgi:osmoprotectant transport system ATP-binding protein